MGVGHSPPPEKVRDGGRVYESDSITTLEEIVEKHSQINMDVESDKVITTSDSLPSSSESPRDRETPIVENGSPIKSQVNPIGEGDSMQDLGGMPVVSCFATTITTTTMTTSIMSTVAQDRQGQPYNLSAQILKEAKERADQITKSLLRDVIDPRVLYARPQPKEPVAGQSADNGSSSKRGRGSDEESPQGDAQPPARKVKKAAKKLNFNQQPHQQNANTDATKKAQKPPPIMLQNQAYFPTLERNVLGAVARSGFEAVRKGNRMAIYMNTQEDYEMVQKVLRDGDFRFHARNKRESDTNRYIIRNLATTTEIDDISFSLSMQGVDASHLAWKPRPHVKPGESKFYPLLILETPEAVPRETVLAITIIASQRVVIEGERKQGPPVCGRCQGYNHVKRDCNLAPICGNCTGGHLTQDCTDTRDQPKCAKCGEVGHRPTFKGCTSYQKWLSERRTKQTQQISITPTTPSSTPTSAKTPKPPRINAWFNKTEKARERRGSQTKVSFSELNQNIAKTTTTTNNNSQTVTNTVNNQQSTTVSQGASGSTTTTSNSQGEQRETTGQETQSGLLGGLGSDFKLFVQTIKQIMEIVKAFKTQGFMATLPLIEALLNSF